MPMLLLVEDDRFLSDTIRSFLEFRNHTVDRAFEGAEALEKMKFGTYDLILLDWHLPGIEGLEICRTYRAEGGTAPVLMLTGHSDSKAHKEAADAGASGYLMKPFKIDVLEENISKMLAKTQPIKT